MGPDGENLTFVSGALTAAMLSDTKPGYRRDVVRRTLGYTNGGYFGDSLRNLNVLLVENKLPR